VEGCEAKQVWVSVMAGRIPDGILSFLAYKGNEIAAAQVPTSTMILYRNQIVPPFFLARSFEKEAQIDGVILTEGEQELLPRVKAIEQ